MWVHHPHLRQIELGLPTLMLTGIAPLPLVKNYQCCMIDADRFDSCVYVREIAIP